MNASQKVAGFSLGLAAVFAAAIGIGATLGPDGGDTTVDNAQMHPGAPAGQQETMADEPPAGLMSTENGYTLELGQSRFDAKKDAPLRFRILDSSGSAVTNYVDSHEKQLHLIVVRRDMVGFQHVHPVLDGDGTWSVPADFSRGGDYRVFADFTPEGGEAVTLGADVRVAGRYDPRPLPAAETTTTVDGYTVTLSGNPHANKQSPLTLTVSRGGKPVTDLQPYLGAYGHLVTLRASDLAYLHVHPMGEPGDGTTPAGPEIGFHTTIPSNDEYRLFLDFKHNDVVRTAEFTLAVGAPASGEPAVPPAAPAPAVIPAEPAPGGHGH